MYVYVSRYFPVSMELLNEENNTSSLISDLSKFYKIAMSVMFFRFKELLAKIVHFLPPSILLMLQVRHPFLEMISKEYKWITLPSFIQILRNYYKSNDP